MPAAADTTNDEQRVHNIMRDHGFDPAGLDLSNADGEYECPHPKCDRVFDSHYNVSHHFTPSHDGPIMECVVGDEWPDILRDLIKELAVHRLAKQFPTYYGRKLIGADAERYDITKNTGTVGGTAGRLERMDLEDLGLSPMGEVR